MIINIALFILNVKNDNLFQGDIMDEKRIRVILGSRIMQRRKQLCIKQSELAEKIGVSNNQISNIENGKSFPKLGNFIFICNILNCNADYFLSGILKDSVVENITDMLSTLSVEEQKTVWQLLDCYIHREDNERM